MPDILVTRPSPGVGCITLNRPEVLNAISVDLERGLRSALVAFGDDSTVQAIVLTGAGRAFSAGIDLREVAEHGFGVRTLAPGEASLPMVFERLRKPVIAAVNGVAVTGGFELALMCDIRIASTQARFADTHARVGVVPGWGLSQRLPRMVGAARAKELSLTGNYLDAVTAERWGLVNRVVEPQALMTHAVGLARDMADCAGPVRDTILELIDYGTGVDLAAGLAHERAVADGHNGRVDGASIAERRAALNERGRRQNAQD